MTPCRVALLGALATLNLSAPASAATFATTPDVPTLPGVQLDGTARTVTAAMPDWAVSNNVVGVGWNVTVAGDDGAGLSPVFRLYCPGPSACGPDPAGYVSGAEYGSPGGSLTLDSTGATFTGALGAKPQHLCAAGCALDSASAVKIASALSTVGVGTWTATGYGSASLSLAIPTTIRAPRDAAEVYRVDLVWTLGSGP